jgi:hypothetical protein
VRELAMRAVDIAPRLEQLEGVSEEPCKADRKDSSCL